MAHCWGYHRSNGPSLGYGLRAWARAGVLAGLVTLAGCGSVSYRAGATSTPSGVQTTRPAELTSLGPPAGTRADALRLARHLLSSVVLPQGATAMGGPPPAALSQPGIPASTADAVEVYGLWTAPGSMDTATSFLRGRPPTGMSSNGAGESSGPGGITAEETDYVPASLPAGISDAGLVLRVAPGRPGRSVIRAIVQVRWYPPRTAAEYVQPAEIHAVTVTATMINTRPHSITRTFTAPSVIDRLARLLNAMHATPAVVMRCPAMLASYRVTFTARPGARPGLEAATGGCLTVTVTANGRP